MTKHSLAVRSLLLSTLACLLAAPLAEAAGYLGPASVLASKDGKTLYVAELDARQIAVVDPAAGKVVKTIAMPAEPTGLALSPDGATLYVTCAAPKSTVCVVDLAGGKIAASIPAGHTATGLAVSPDGKRLYVCNRFNNDVSVIDLAAKQGDRPRAGDPRADRRGGHARRQDRVRHQPPADRPGRRLRRGGRGHGDRHGHATRPTHDPPAQRQHQPPRASASRPTASTPTSPTSWPATRCRPRNWNAAG